LQCYCPPCCLRHNFIWASGIRVYEIKCNTCGLNYVGQSGRSITTRHKEHIRYIRNNNPTSAYAVYTQNNRHEYGTTENTLQLIKPCRKSSKMNNWENIYNQIYRQHGKLIEEQQVNEINPLFDYARPPNTLKDSIQRDEQREGKHDSNTNRNTATCPDKVVTKTTGRTVALQREQYP
jgi:hypothetical protein